jgi:transposase
MCAVPKPYPRDFRDDVVAVAQRREPGVMIKQVADAFGISETCLQNCSVSRIPDSLSG